MSIKHSVMSIKHSVMNNKHSVIQITKKLFSLFQCVKFTNIEQLEVILRQAHDMRPVTHAEIEIDDGETVGETLHEWKKFR